MIWNIFSNGLLNAASSMVANANIIKKIYFPRLIIPLSSILTALFDYIFAFAAFIILLIYYQLPFPLWKLLVFTPLSILLTVITTFGLGTFLASLNIKYRDFQYALPFMIQFLLFLNPVLYSTQVFENLVLQRIMQFNPIAGAINLMRSIFKEGSIDWILLGCQFLVALVLMMIGVYFFRKTEGYFADLA